MDLLSALKNELFRPLASVVLPGVLALSPYVIIGSNAIPELLDFYKAQPNWFLLAVLAAGTVLGLLLEDVGSSIERGIDRCIDLEYLHGHDKVWLAYLSNGTADNNGRRFLSSTVTRLKFLNSLIPALIIFAVGVFCLHWQVGRWEFSSMIWFGLFVLALLCWIFRTSTEMSEVASTTRYCLLASGDRPAEYDVDAKTVRRVRHLAYTFVELVTSRASSIDLRGRNPLAALPEAFQLFFGRKETNTGGSSPTA